MNYTIRTNYKWGQVPFDQANQIRKWLYCFVGEPYRHWKADYDRGQLVMKFVSDKDATMFSLKFSI